MTRADLLHCPIKAKIRTADSQSDLRIMLYVNSPFGLLPCSDELSAFIESKGAPAPGILTLTTSLSNVG